ncbi:ATP-binding cassette domain-containing protein [Anaerocolumna sp. AGMB13020]|uniref:ATP-binding cassette domain-containing protein n=1 Tax=Anaerocolumna sp. AGMB13020 TaxID=3081750 RepID=UPI002952DE9C|nr:ATP-binding cassette domain-containing protein [Anaerocolumna sp. AGMB13020]WOO35377.1 ATP-binding cassette domain-containing protein [Anaerocolumna sp. AGMB13020]
MLDIRNVTITNREDNRCIIKEFNFTLNRGQKAVIIGEEGNGKSTLLKFIYDKTLIEDYCDYTGQVTSGVRCGYLKQEADEEWLKMSPAEYLKEVDIYSIRDENIWAFNPDPVMIASEDPIKNLSGGERVKLQLLKLLADEPDVLLLDEPTNDLDIGSLTWLEDFINRTDKPVLYVSHDETLIEHTANVIIHLEQLKRKTEPHYSVSYMSYDEYKNQRSSSLAKQEMTARKQREEYEDKMDRFRQIYDKVEHQQNAITRANPAGGRLLKKKIKSLKSQEKRYEKEKDDFLEIPDTEDAILYDFPDTIKIPRGKRIIEFKLGELKVGEGTEERILSQDIYLRVMGPEHIAIIGDNGTGKTTLLRKIAAELLNRTDIKAAYMPQNYEEVLDYKKTPIEFLTTSGQKEDITKAFTYMGGMKFTRDEMEHTIGELSGGQKAKLILLKMILEGVEVLILDEPTRNLSPLSNPVIRGVLASYKGAIISVTHDRKYMEEVAEKLYKLTEKGLIEKLK